MKDESKSKAQLIEELTELREMLTIQAPSRIVKDESARPIRVEGTFLDVTKSAQAQRARQRSEELLAVTLKSISDAVISTDREGRVMFMNPTAEAATGWMLDEAAGRPLEDIFDIRNEDTGKKVESPMKRVFREGVVVGLANHTKLIRKDQTELPIADSCAPIRDEGGEIIGAVLVFQDITDRRKVETALRESEHRLREAQEMAGLGNWFWDVNTGEVEWSDEVFNIFRLDPKTFTPQIDSILDLSPWPEERERDKELIQRAMETRETGSYEQRFLRPDGSTGYYFSIFQGIYGDDDKLTAIRGTVQDITERKRVEEDLRRSESFLNSIIEQSPFSTWISDDKGTLLRMNQACRDLLKISDDEVVNKYNVLEDNIVEQQGHMALVKKVFQDGEVVHFSLDYNSAKLETLDLRSPSSLLLEVSIFPIKDDSGRVTNAVIQHLDVTARECAIEELHESERRFRLFFDHAPVGNCITAPGGRLLRVNSAFGEMLGYTQEEMSKLQFSAITHPDDFAESQEWVRCLLAGERDTYTMEQRYLHKNGQPVWTHVTTRLLRDGAGDPVHFLTHIRDITEMKLMQAQIAQSDRMATMGMLAAGVAHEINNPLTFVIYNLESLTDDLPKLSSALRKCLDIIVDRIGNEEWAQLMGQDQEFLNPAMLDDIRARFKKALQGSNRIRDVAQGLGAFSRVERDRMVPVDLMHVIEVATNMAFNEIKYRARLVKEYGQISTILANDGRLSQVFLNLLINAAHSITEGDSERNEIRVRTWQEGSEIFAEVRDTGKGISRENLPQLFEPFFTTKEVGVGTGLGLTISKTIVEEYGGLIEVESEVGKGSRFVVRLPVTKAAEEDEAAQVDKVAGSCGVRGRILVIDDEADIRDIMVQILSGHDVAQAVSGNEAQKILEVDQAFDLILCDMMMPIMSGVDLHKWLLAAHPDLARRVVFVTGGAFTPKASEHLSKVSNIHIEKPFNLADFKELVDKLIVAYRNRRS